MAKPLPAPHPKDSDVRSWQGAAGGCSSIPLPVYRSCPLHPLQTEVTPAWGRLRSLSSPDQLLLVPGRNQAVEKCTGVHSSKWPLLGQRWVIFLLELPFVPEEMVWMPVHSWFLFGSHGCGLPMSSTSACWLCKGQGEQRFTEAWIFPMSFHF